MDVLFTTYLPDLLSGLAVTLQITAVAFIGALVFGTVLATFRISPIAPLRWVGAAYVEVFRNVPLVALVVLVVYGLPEINRDKIKGARLIANPGCYPTAVQLGFLPLLESGAVDTGFLVADAKSGVSGAGRKPETHVLFAEAADNFKAYAVGGHRHWPEIKQGLDSFAGKAVDFTFVPHLTPLIRGIHATLYARISGDIDLQALYEKRYAGEAFVDVMPAGAHPETRSVRGANVCRIAVHRPQGGDTVVVLSVIDNLVKGAAGQAVQNMNILFDLPEDTALGDVGMLP